MVRMDAQKENAMSIGATIDIHGIDASIMADHDDISLDRVTLVEPIRLVRWMVEGMDVTDIDAAIEVLKKELSERETHTAQQAPPAKEQT